jgi:histone H3/H4
MLRPSETAVHPSRKERRFSVAKINWGIRRPHPATPGIPVMMGGNMAARKKKAKKAAGGDLIISKTRTKNAVKKCNVGGEFYGALDQAVRGLIKDAEARAIGNKRKTLKAVDL